MTDFSQTFNVSTNPARHPVGSQNKAIAQLAKNQDDLIEALNTMLDNLEGSSLFIPLSLLAAREVDANGDVGAIATGGGTLGSDSTPILQSIGAGAATDNAQRINWAASNSDPILFQTALDPDINVGANLEIHLRVASADTTDTAGFAADIWFNEGDTKVAVATVAQAAALADYEELTLTIPFASIPAGAQNMTIMLTPKAHTTDKMYLSGAWLEGTKIRSLL